MHIEINVPIRSFRYNLWTHKYMKGQFVNFACLWHSHRGYPVMTIRKDSQSFTLLFKPDSSLTSVTSVTRTFKRRVWHSGRYAYWLSWWDVEKKIHIIVHDWKQEVSAFPNHQTSFNGADLSVNTLVWPQINRCWHLWLRLPSYWKHACCRVSSLGLSFSWSLKTVYRVKNGGQINKVLYALMKL